MLYDLLRSTFKHIIDAIQNFANNLPDKGEKKIPDKQDAANYTKTNQERNHNIPRFNTSYCLPISASVFLECKGSIQIYKFQVR